MNLRFKCTNCGKSLGAKSTSVGRTFKCPRCGTAVSVPSESPTSAATSPAADEAGHSADTAAGPPADHSLLLVPPHKGYGDLIDMTAMVDIVFFLLIFFLVTSMQALEAVINLPAPQSTASSNVQAVPDITNDPSFVVVTIDADDAVWVEDEEALSEQDLRTKLRTALREDERESMLIKGAGDATHGKFVMVLDAGADAGVKELLFSVEGTEEETDGG